MSKHFEEQPAEGDLVFSATELEPLLRTYHEECSAAFPVGHPLAKGKRATLRQIAKYPLILPPKDLRFTFRRMLEGRFQKYGLDYKIVMESSNVELTSLYVEIGLGISFATLVRDLPALKQRKLEFLPVNQLFKPDYIAVVVRKGKTLASDKSFFLNILLGGSARL